MDSPSQRTNTRAGWVVVVVGFAMALVFLPLSEVAVFWRFRGTLDQVPGQVVSVRRTSSWENDEVPILGVDYEFTDRDGTARRGVSYSTDPVTPGSPVAIEFPEGDASYSRIVGMRSRAWGLSTLLLLAVPAFGFLMVGVGTLIDRKARRSPE